MKAMVMVFGDGCAQLDWRDVPDPAPGPGELLIRVCASAVNRADIYQRQGGYPVSKGDDAGKSVIAGLEAAGEVIATGKGVKDFEMGDRVMGMCSGAYAESVVLDSRLAIKVPERLNWQQAATIPVAYMTEHNALVTNGRLEIGESVLINAASSGVAVAGIQIARLFGARPLIGISGSPLKFNRLKEFGLDHCINYQVEDFSEAVMGLTSGRGVNLIIDHVGAPLLDRNLRCMALKGRLVSVGRLGGEHADLNLDFVALRRLQIIGVTFRTRTIMERIEIARRFEADVLPAIADGRIQPVIDRIFPLQEAAAAQDYLVSNSQTGKVVLECG
jgi:NADPH2:quinone reductase